MSTSAASSAPRVAVIGAGWAGWGAAKALCENGVQVTLIDGVEDPTGATPMLTPSGKPFEPGTRGFWKDYPNIEDLVQRLGMSLDDVFTPFTESSFYSPYGLEARAPVFSDSKYPQLPSPLGQVLATVTNFKRLPLSDRVTMAGLLYGMLDYGRDEETFAAYDRMTAHELFLRMRMSKRLVDDFVRPTLLVGLFKAPEELSAAVAMELLYYYALAHQTSFDVRWIKKSSIAEAIIAPLAARLQTTTDINVMGGTFAESVALGAGGRVEAGTLDGLDGCVLAVGAKGMRAIVNGSPALAKACPELTAAASLNTIDVMATRIWLDGYVATDTPANVLSRFAGLRGAGGTFFMLDQLQDNDMLWGGETPQGSVVAADFYNAGALLALSDEDIVELLLQELLPQAVPGFAKVKAVDAHVVRYPGAVSFFSPGSYRSRPPLQTTVPNLVCAGDWVRMGEREHGAKGLCQERAFVSGLEAANALARNGSLGPAFRRQHDVIPIRADEPQVVVSRAVNKGIMEALKPLGLASPWVR
ncbi:oxidase [Tribonema minus]|uniref:Oxidase n=1 Tax=Tribonema minus TaxID=303371 RepID=A0A835ZCT6_9STRA|nr:oxidase [Tribonema minus]